MTLTSAIEWTDATWNPWQGCTKVSAACQHCYMFREKSRFGHDPSVVHRSAPGTFRLPLKRNKSGEYAIPSGSKVFTCSWSDWFHEAADAWRPEAWAIIKQRPDLTFQILTKRPERIATHLPNDWDEGYPNVRLGVTVENQPAADERNPELLAILAAGRFLSMEPLLGQVDLSGFFGGPYYGFPGPRVHDNYNFGIHWVIAGGESGPNARPMHPDWVRSLRDQCKAAGVPFFFKQWGEWIVASDKNLADHGKQWRSESPDCCWVDIDGRIQPESSHGLSDRAFAMIRVGKKAAGRLLDGVEHSEFPEAVL